jgi:hypothetical protein
MKRVLAVVAVALAIASIVRYSDDRSARAAAEKFVLDFDVDERRPEIASTLPLVPAADLAADVVADIALSDAFGTVHLADVSPELREKWLRAVERLGSELNAARDITLDALAARPGWPRHWTTLGELVYASQRRSFGANDARLWQTPLRMGIELFPGDDSATTFASTAFLESWPELTDAARAHAVQGFRRALLDPAFASRSFPLLIAAIGPDDAIAMLPPVADTLRSAFDSFAHNGEVANAAAIYRRWEAAEWASRISDLRELEERARLNDVEKQRDVAQSWLARHRPTDFDTPAGREQVLRVLQLAVNDRVGSWQNDVRGPAVRFLLNRRMTPGSAGRRGIETAPGGAIVATVVASMTSVPDPIRARVHLLGGDVEGARSIFDRSDSAGSFEWTPFLLDLAEYRLSQGSADGVHSALDGLSPATHDECDVLAVRRKLAQLEGATIPAAPPPHAQTLPATAWSTNGALSLCIEEGTSRELITTVEAQQPALVAWGWNDGRHGVLYLQPGRTNVRVSTIGRTGRQTFFIRTLAGAPATLGATTL